MEKINITLRQETLHNIVAKLQHDYESASAIFEVIFGSIKSGEWNVEIINTSDEVIKIKTQKQLAEYLKKTFSPKARKQLRASIHKNG